MASGGDRKIERNRAKCLAYKNEGRREINKFRNLVKHTLKRALQIRIKLASAGYISLETAVREQNKRLRGEIAALSRLTPKLPGHITKPHTKMLADAYSITV